MKTTSTDIGCGDFMGLFLFFVGLPLVIVMCCCLCCFSGFLISDVNKTTDIKDAPNTPPIKHVERY